MWPRRPSVQAPFAAPSGGADFSSRPIVRASTLHRPSMHSEYMGRKESTASSSNDSIAPAMALPTAMPMRSGRLRSLSNDSDSSKRLSSVPLLCASTISSMSTLSSSFYQYDSTGTNNHGFDIDTMPTPSSISSGGTTPGFKRSQQSQQDPPLRLPPGQERAIRSDAARMTRELVAEQLRALHVLHNRSALVGGHHAAAVAIGQEVAIAKGVRVFEKSGLGGGVVPGRPGKKNAVKRYTAHCQVYATVDEVLALLVRDDREPEKYASCQAALHPETVNSKLLWRAPLRHPSKPRSKSQRSVSTVNNGDDASEEHYTGENDDDDNGVIIIETDDADEVRFANHQPNPATPYRSGTSGHGHGKPFPPKAPKSVKSVASSSATTHRPLGASRQRRRRRGPSPAWMGISWWVQHMPHKLSRDRDFIVLEKQSAFETHSGSPGKPSRRGFVHLSHSVDLADVSSVEKRLLSSFVRALVIQSGLVIVESEEPGVLDVTSTLELDCAGHLTTNQQRQLVVKRLLQMETLSDLLWKTRLLSSQVLLRWKPKLENTSHYKKCDRCQFKVSRFSRRSLEPCRACERVVCTNCSSACEFPPALIAAASPQRQLPMDVDSDGVLKARVCAHCVAEYSRPRLAQQEDEDDEDEEEDDEEDEEDDEEADERADVAHKALPPYLLHSQHASQRKLSRQSSASIMRPSDWNPTRSSRIAESLVDNFLMNMSPGAAMQGRLLESPMSPSALSEDLELSTHRGLNPASHQQPVSEPVSEPEPETGTQTEEVRDVVQASSPTEPQRRESKAVPMRRPSTASFYTPLQGYDPGVPRRKRSMFEMLPEPAPRKNVVLYEG